MLSPNTGEDKHYLKKKKSINGLFTKNYHELSLTVISGGQTDITTS